MTADEYNACFERVLAFCTDRDWLELADLLGNCKEPGGFRAPTGAERALMRNEPVLEEQLKQLAYAVREIGGSDQAPMFRRFILELY